MCPRSMLTTRTNNSSIQMCRPWLQLPSNRYITQGAQSSRNNIVEILGVKRSFYGRKIWMLKGNVKGCDKRPFLHWRGSSCPFGIFSNGYKMASFSHTLGTPDKSACQSGNALTVTTVVIQCAFHRRHLTSQCGPATWKWLATLMLYFLWPPPWQTFPHLTVFGILLRTFPSQLVDILHRVHSGILFAETLLVTHSFAFHMVSYPPILSTWDHTRCCSIFFSSWSSMLRCRCAHLSFASFNFCIGSRCYGYAFQSTMCHIFCYLRSRWCFRIWRVFLCSSLATSAPEFLNGGRTLE